MRRGHRLLDRALLAACVALLGATVLYPTARLLLEVLREWRPAAILEGEGPRAIWNTLLLSFASVAGAGAVGTTLAFVLARREFPGRALLSALALLPFTLPPLVGTLSFYYLIGRDGFVPRFAREVLGLADFAIGGFWAILLIHVYSFYVFFYAMVGPALESLDRAQLEAARTLGASPARVFFRVTLPLLAPSLLGASLLTFMSSGASFSAPYFFGGGFPVLSVLIFNERQDDMPAALTLTVVLALVALLGVALFRSGREARGAASKGVRVPLRGRRARWLAGAAAWGCILLLIVPHLTILGLSFVDHRAWHTEIIPTTLTLESYTRLVTNPQAFAPIRNSLWTSALATLAALAAALPAAYLIARRRPGGRWVNLLVMIPWALPGTVIAINLIVAFNDRWLPLHGTVWMLPLAYFVRGVPLMTRMAAAVIEPFDPALIEAGRSLGASPARCFTRIVLPLIAPAIIAAMALTFATSLGEFVASILVYVPGNIPISVQINEEIRAAGGGAAFAYSVLLMLLVAATFALSRRFSPRPV